MSERRNLVTLDGTTLQGEPDLTVEVDSLEKLDSLEGEGDRSHGDELDYKTMNWWHLTLRMCFSPS
jgi:hypothetical protein